MPDKKSNSKRINPEVTDIEIGVRHLRNITFYPLSAAQQLKMTGLLEDIFKELLGMEQGGNDESIMVFVSRVLEIIRNNIEMLVEMITDEKSDKLLADMTNSQLVEVVQYVYTTNYEGPLKNLLSLFQNEEEDNKWRGLVLNQLSPQSAKSTGTPSTTSTKKGTEKEGQPSVN
jgi:hypothetical protein